MAMGTKGEGKMPQPFGDEVALSEWKRIFLHILKYSPNLNFYDGSVDVNRELLRINLQKEDTFELLIDELPSGMKHDNSEQLLLVRAHYYEGGLHHRISFNGRVQSRLNYEAYPAHRIRVIQPIRKVSNLFISYTSDEMPVYLEVPVAGIPSVVVVQEASIEKIKAYSKQKSKLQSKTHFIKGMLLQMGDIGAIKVDGRLTPQDIPDKEGQYYTIDLDPLSPEANKYYDQFLFDEFQSSYNPRKHNKKQEVSESINNDTLSHPRFTPSEEPPSRKPKAFALIEDPSLRKKMKSILEELEWDITIHDSFSPSRQQVDIMNSDMLILDNTSGERHAVDIMRELIRDEIIVPMRFVIMGSKLSLARESEWEGIGQGIFLRSQLPDSWLSNKLATWLENTEDQRRKVSDESSNKPLILIADDDKNVVEVLAEGLMVRQFRVITAYNGDDALRSARNLNPDLVLLDINMPKSSGLDVLRELRSYDSTRLTPVIMVTGQKHREQVQVSLQFGAEDYIVKPFDLMNLIDRIQNILNIE
ncbi:response regulator [bacterium]|nr:response regulator [bacterium]